MALNLKFRITGDASGVKKATKEASAAVKIFEKEGKDALSSFGSALGINISSIERMGDAVAGAVLKMRGGADESAEKISKLTYPMLADPTQAIARDFEVLIEGSGLAERGTFIINPECKIVGYEVNDGNVGRNADELFRKLQAFQFVHEHGDEVCPAKWTPGAETLKPSLDLVGAL